MKNDGQTIKISKFSHKMREQLLKFSAPWSKSLRVNNKIFDSKEVIKPFTAAACEIHY